MEALGLKQHITVPTHYKGNILDLIFTETTSQIKVSQPSMLNFISDHRLISATISVEKDVPKITRKKVRNYKNANPATMMENFNLPILDLNTDINEAQTQLTTRLQDMIDKSVPDKMVKRPKNHKTPGSMIPSGTSAQLSKTEKEHGGNMGNNTTGRHIQ